MSKGAEARQVEIEAPDIKRLATSTWPHFNLLRSLVRPQQCFLVQPLFHIPGNAPSLYGFGNLSMFHFSHHDESGSNRKR
jgi:hypothetical protein